MQTAVTDTNLLRFRAAVAGALAHLESRRQEVNDLNVFPVADGDTGDNMALTLRAVLGELDRLQGADETRTIDEIGREEIVQSVARAALLGARGNSGVILSQLIRGAAEELVSRPGELIDAALIAAALENAAERAYASVRSPAEGTILTVAREMAERIATENERDPEGTRLHPTAAPELQDRAIATTLEQAVVAGQESVKRGPELLAALRDAGVVDAGGYGLVVIFAGVVAALRGEDPPPLDHYAPARIHHPEHHSSTYRYCTNFAVTGRALESERFLPRLEALGDSVLVVGDDATLKVHIHTDDPERATTVFDGAGEVSHLDVADMHAQVAEREGRLGGSNGSASSNCFSVAPMAHTTSAGPSASRRMMRLRMAWPQAERAGAGGSRAGGALRRGRGGERRGHEAAVRRAGREHARRRPDAQPLHLRAARRDPRGALRGGAGAAVLPERGDGRRARRRALRQAGGRHPRAQSAGRARRRHRAAADRPLEQNAQALNEALARVRTGAVAPAARADPAGRFAPGEAVGFLGEEVVAWGEPATTLRQVLVALADGAELLSVLAGEEAPLDPPAVAALLDGDLGAAELEQRHGGQSAYWWLLAAE